MSDSIASRITAGYLLLAMVSCACSSRSTESPNPKRDYPQLIATATDSRANVDQRLQALSAIGQIATRAAEAKPRLLALLTDDNAEIAARAKVALRRLDGNGALSFQRVAVLGASVSAGFFGTPIATVLDESIAETHEVENLADLYFFRSPVENGKAHVDAALAFDATLVVAVDILFWYVYVSGADLDYRLARLERGLRNLERIEVPLVIGDIPDMRRAKTWMLPPEVVPPAEHLKAVNARIRAWARDRSNVHVVPLATWAEPLLTGESVEENGKTLTAADLMSLDGLHLNPAGVRYLLRKVDADLSSHFPDTPDRALVITN